MTASRSVPFVLACVVLLGLGGVASPSPHSTPHLSANGLSLSVDDTLRTLSRRIFEEANRVRADNNVSTLQPDSALVRAACTHTQDMHDRNFLRHDNPDGDTPVDRVARLHRRLVGTVGENLWSRTGQGRPDRDELAALVVEQWMNSPGHRKNLLRPNFTHMGICSIQRNEKLLVTQVFAAASAYLNEPLPYRLEPGQQVPISIDPSANPSASAEKYDLWHPPTETRVAGPAPLDTAIAFPDTTGTYRLRLYFPEGNRYQVATGPEIELRRAAP